MASEEQIIAILSGRSWEVADEKTWAATLQELEEFVLRYGFPMGHVITTKGTYDGLYLVQANNRYEVYEQERSVIKTDIQGFDSYQTAVRYVLKKYYAPKIRPNDQPQKIILSTKL